MAKFYGAIGFGIPKETSPGIWTDTIEEYFYDGDMNRNIRRLQTVGGNVNDDVNISNEISIVADPFAVRNIFSMKYVTYQGTKWKISDVSVQSPRLVLTIGGVYNG